MSRKLTPEEESMSLKESKANDNSVSCVSEKMIKDHAAHFLLMLTASSLMTVSQISFIKDSVTEANTVSLAKQSASHLLRNL